MSDPAKPETGAAEPPAAPASATALLSEQKMSWADMSDEEDDLTPVVPAPQSNVYQAPRSTPTEHYADYKRHGGRGRGGGYRDRDRESDRRHRDNMGSRRSGRGGGGGGGDGRRHGRDDMAAWGGGGSRERFRDGGFQHGGSQPEMSFKPKSSLQGSQSTSSLSSARPIGTSAGTTQKPKINLSKLTAAMSAPTDEGSRNSKIFGEAKPREETAKPDSFLAETVAPKPQESTLIQEQDHSQNMPSSSVRPITFGSADPTRIPGRLDLSRAAVVLPEKINR